MHDSGETPARSTQIGAIGAATIMVVDWGSTRFRAYLVGKSQAVLARKQAPLGLLQINPSEFPRVLREQLHEWLDTYPLLPILMSGMVGSRRGWQEAAYVSTPANLNALSQHLLQLRWECSNPLFIVPGIDTQATDAHYDVMRGEEVQVFGALTLLREQTTASHHLCLPGTHSKWVEVCDDSIVNFRTHMTGELFQLLSTRSLLATSMSNEEHDSDAFARGVRAAISSPAAHNNLAYLVFGARTLALNGQLTEQQVASYLSGLLIGQEIVSEKTGKKPVVFIGDRKLCAYYSAASRLLAMPHHIVDAEHATVRGMFALWECCQ